LRHSSFQIRRIFVARGYTVAVASLAVGVGAKWLDNLLSHHHVEGVTRGRRGVGRTLSHGALVRIAVAAALVRELDCTVARALRLAERVASTPDGHITLAQSLELRVELRRIERDLATRIADAVETAGHRRRGRPVKKRASSV
jgi:hypothetical protein